MMVVCVVGVPITKNFAAHRCALQPAALAAAPLPMAIARNVRKPPTRVCGGVPLGAPRRLFCAAAGVSSGLAGGVKAARAKSKLGKIEAKTVRELSALVSSALRMTADMNSMPHQSCPTMTWFTTTFDFVVAPASLKRGRR